MSLNYFIKDQIAFIAIKEDETIKQLLAQLKGKVNLVFSRLDALESIENMETNNYLWVIFPFLASDGRYIISVNGKLVSYLYSCAEKSEELEMRDQINALLKQIKRKVEARSSFVWTLGDKAENIHLRSSYFSVISLKIILQKIHEQQTADLAKGQLNLVNEYAQQELTVRTNYLTIKEKIKALDLNKLSQQDNSPLVKDKEQIILNYREDIVPKLLLYIKRIRTEVIVRTKKTKEDMLRELKHHLEEVKINWESYLNNSREDLILDLGLSNNSLRKNNTQLVLAWIKDLLPKNLVESDYLGLEQKWTNFQDDYDGSLFTYQELVKEYRSLTN